MGVMREREGDVRVRDSQFGLHYFHSLSVALITASNLAEDEFSDGQQAPDLSPVQSLSEMW